VSGLCSELIDRLTAERNAWKSMAQTYMAGGEYLMVNVEKLGLLKRSAIYWPLSLSAWP
jgi:hypothetical protein